MSIRKYRATYFVGKQQFCLNGFTTAERDAAIKHVGSIIAQKTAAKWNPLKNFSYVN